MRVKMRVKLPTPKSFTHMLNEIMIKNALPKDKQYKLADGNGLTLVVYPNGSKYWQLRYRFAGKEKTLSLGVYPDVTLKEARVKGNKAKVELSEGIDPSHKKKVDKISAIYNSENSFYNVALEWHGKQKATWTERHAKRIWRTLELNIMPLLGKRPIKEITAPELLLVLRPLEERGILDTAHEMLATCGRIFRYGIVTGRAERDLSADLKGALEPHKVKNFNRISAKELPALLKKIEAWEGIYTRLALKLLSLTFVRPGELRYAKWSEIDFDKKEWRIPAEGMKMRIPHIVPLSTQAIRVLEEVRQYRMCDYIFPSTRSVLKPMSENTMLYALYDMGYRDKMTAHGFRGLASTILNEHGFNRDHIERQLAHSEGNKVRAAYNYAEYLPERREMMQWWGDYLNKTQLL